MQHGRAIRVLLEGVHARIPAGHEAGGTLRGLPPHHCHLSARLQHHLLALHLAGRPGAGNHHRS